MCKDFTNFYAVRQLIVELYVSVNLTEVDLDRCAILEFSSRGRTLSQFYGRINNPEYHIRPQIKFLKASKYLSETPDVIQGRSMAPHSNGKL